MADENAPIDRDEVERLLQHRGPEESQPDKAPEGPSQGSSSGDSLDQANIEGLMSQAGQKNAAQAASATQTSQVSDPADPSKTDSPLSQGNIDQLLSQAQGGSTPGQRPPTPQEGAPDGPPATDDAVVQGDV